MNRLILIARHGKTRCHYWSQLLEDAAYRTALCWTNATDVLHQTRADKPDLLLIEFDFDDGQGFETARQAMMAHPALRCIMVLPAGMTHYPKAIQTDISGYLPEDLDDPAELLLCIDQIGQGYRYISEQFWGALRAPADQNIQLINGLSERRKQLLRLVAKGFTARQMALELDIAEATVRHHKEEISKVLGLSGMYQLKIFAGSVAYLLEQGE